MIICMNFTIIIITFLCLYFVISKVSKFATMGGVLLTFLELLAYGLTSWINPGMPRLEKIEYSEYEKIKDNKAMFCKICGIVRKKGKHIMHCEDCDICVEGYDHHCPWTGKCIGRRNLPFFYCFLVGTPILFFYTVFVTALCSYFFRFFIRIVLK